MASHNSRDLVLAPTPSLIVYNGVMITEAMLKERINEDEVYAVLRENGIAVLEDAKAVVLETDGSLTVIGKSAEDRPGALDTVRTY